MKRFLTSVLPVSGRRRGQCIDCGACCRLPTPCIFLGSDEDGRSFCRIYAFRPLSCRKYPRTESEFVTQGDCGYWFESASEPARPSVAVVQFYPLAKLRAQTSPSYRVAAGSDKRTRSLARRIFAMALGQAGWAALRSSKTE